MKKLFTLCISLFISTLCEAQIISEICASNGTVWEHPSEGFSDWIEIYNDSETPIGMEGWFLTNELANLSKWEFPDLEILPNERIVFPANSESVNENTISFSFKRGGGTYYLVNPENLIVDWVDQPHLQTDHSYGRIENKWYYFGEPTPVLANESSIGFKGYANQPSVNRASQKCRLGTYIVIRPVGEDQTVHYSTNGGASEITQLYSTPIVLYKNLSIRAVAKGDSLLDSPALKRTYFVSDNHHLPIVNLNVDSLELFDADNGIYMLGNDAGEEIPHWGANFWEDREVHAYYEYFDKDMNLIEALDCDLKIHGGFSRILPIKSLQLKAKKSYDQEAFEHSYFEDKELTSFKRLVLRNAGNDYCNSTIKDAAFQKHLLQDSLDIDMLAYNPVVVYINGHYWGIQNMREKVDRYYCESNYGVNPDSVNMLEKHTLGVLSGSADSFIEMQAYAVENDLSIQSNYDWVAERLDIKSMADYFIVELYLDNKDWPHNNLKLWNAPTQKKWRYICYDLDAGFRYNGNELEDYQTLHFVMGNFLESNPHVALFDALLKNPDFKRYFVNRYADLLNSTFIASKVYEAITDQKEVISHDMERHYTKWCGEISQWNSRFNGLKGFIDGRQEIVRDELSDYFELPADVQFNINTYPENAGDVVINSLRLKKFPFYGRYYPTNMVDLEAIPNPGEIFEYWENARTGERFYTTKITVNPVDSDYYLATFKNQKNILDIKVYPNPIQDLGVISFSLPSESDVEVLVSTPEGNEVQRYGDWGVLYKGTHKANLRMGELASGLYFVTVITSYATETTSILKL